MTRIHPTAVVDPGAKLAPDVAVGPYAVIGGGVELAKGVAVGAHVSLHGNTSIGAGTRISPFVALGGEPQVVGFSDGSTSLAIGERNEIREFVCMHVGTRKGGGCTRVGDDNLFMNHVHVGHDCQIGSHCVLAAYSGLSGHASVGDHVVFGAMTGVHQHVRIGESVFTAAHSMLAQDAPPFTRVAGDRARFAGVNRVGLERRGFSPETIAQLKHALHVLFHSKLRLEPALETVERECPDSPEVARLLHFLRQSERGFIR